MTNCNCSTWSAEKNILEIFKKLAMHCNARKKILSQPHERLRDFLTFAAVFNQNHPTLHEAESIITFTFGARRKILENILKTSSET